MAQSVALEKAGRAEIIKEGWVTPDGTLFIPAAWDGTSFEKNRKQNVYTTLNEAASDASAAAADAGAADAGTAEAGAAEAGAAEAAAAAAAAAALPAACLHADGSVRDKQIMVLGLDYFTSSALFHCACDERTVDIVAAIFRAEGVAVGGEAAADDVEVFGNGQLVYKVLMLQMILLLVLLLMLLSVLLQEPMGGHLVNFHQDSAFFEFDGIGPVGTLNYAIDTDLSIGNGALYVLPGRCETLLEAVLLVVLFVLLPLMPLALAVLLVLLLVLCSPPSGSHGAFIDTPDLVDTSSHLGLDPAKYNVDSPGMVCVEGKAGDAIFFHQYCVHGSPPNHSQQPRPTFINRYTRPTDDVVMPLATCVAQRKVARSFDSSKCADVVCL